MIGFGLLVIPLAIQLFDSPGPVNRVSGDPFILTYNLNHGFSEDGRMSLETMARIIESGDPDIVALQEVSRGWVATGGVDMVAWLEHRLGIPVIFAASADRQWGMALATGMETTSLVVERLPASYDRFARSTLDVVVDVSDNLKLRVIVTHIETTDSDPEIHLEQLQALVNVWGGSVETVVVGSLGIGDSVATLNELSAAGLSDAARVVTGSAATSPASMPTERFDYVLITKDLSVSAARVLQQPASDHLALLTRIGEIGVGG